MQLIFIIIQSTHNRIPLKAFQWDLAPDTGYCLATGKEEEAGLFSADGEPIWTDHCYVFHEFALLPFLFGSYSLETSVQYPDRL